MKSISNLLLAAILIIYIFLPLFDLGLFGKITGFEFTEQTLNSPAPLGKKIFSLIPFIACFGAIIFNYMKSKAWAIGSCLFILLGLLFYLFAYDFSQQNFWISKIVGLGGGFKVSLWMFVIALASSIISLFPVKLKHKDFNNKPDKGTSDGI